MAGSGFFSTTGPLKPHLVQGPHGQAAEIQDVRSDLMQQLAGLRAETVVEMTAPPAASTAGLKAATATVTTAVTFRGKDLLTAGKNVLAATPRKLTFTTAGGTPANAPANVVISGLNNFGKPVSEILVLAQTAAAVTSVNAYSRVDSLAYPVGDGTAATIAVGWTVALYVSLKPLTRAGLVLIREIMDGAEIAPATGTLTTAGLYTPAAAPNGTHNYAIIYEYDPTF